MNDGSRHSRQIRFPGIGAAGQQKIAAARVSIVGCGALGSHSAELLARAGVGSAPDGFLRIIDRDYVDLSNLQRQALFTEKDARDSRPKARAAADHISEIDGEVRCQPLVRDFRASNAAGLVSGSLLLIDGTDNFEARFLLNDTAISLGIPWLYGGAVGSRGVVSMIVPKTTPCLRCLMEKEPSLGAADSCETAGIITPLPALIASLQVTSALRWLVDGSFDQGIFFWDVWTDPAPMVSFETARPDSECRSCGTGELPSLHSSRGELAVLCGRNSVQMTFGAASGDLDRLEKRFRGILSEVHRHPESLTAAIPEGKLTLFEDGRVIVEGTTDPLEARSIAARYLG